MEENSALLSQQHYFPFQVVVYSESFDCILVANSAGEVVGAAVKPAWLYRALYKAHPWKGIILKNSGKQLTVIGYRDGNAKEVSQHYLVEPE